MFNSYTYINLSILRIFSNNYTLQNVKILEISSFSVAFKIDRLRRCVFITDSESSDLFVFQDKSENTKK